VLNGKLLAWPHVKRDFTLIEQRLQFRRSQGTQGRQIRQRRRAGAIDLSIFEEVIRSRGQIAG
jgi:hypothetical protein